MKRIFIASLFFLFLTIIYFFPLVKNINNLIVDDYDGLLITWSLNRVAKELPETIITRGFSWPEFFFNGNIFYPYFRSHAYSDAFITDGLMAAPFLRLFSEPIAAFNINILLGQWLFLFFTFLLLSEISGNYFLSVLLAAAFGFSNFRFQYLGHLQTFTLYWIPLGFWSLLKYFAYPEKYPAKKITGKVYLIFFFFAFLAQTLNSFLPGFFLIFIFGILLSVKREAWKKLKNDWRIFLICFFLVCLILLPVIGIYQSVSREFNYVRPISDAIHFSLSPEEIFTRFFNWPLGLLFLVSVFFFFKTEQTERKKDLPFILILFSGLIMALGPFLHWFKKTLLIPLPYIFFYYFIPGFKGFRTPSRWIFLFGLGMVVFIASVLKDRPKNNLKKEKLFFCFFYFLVIFLGMISFKPPEKYFSIPKKENYPPVYSRLKNLPEAVILELPIYYWGDFQFGKREPLRMIYSLEHGKKTVNGYSGFSPPEWESLVIKLRRDFLSKDNLANIKAIGVNYLVIHEEEFKDLWPEDYENKIAFLNKSKELKEIFRKDGNVIYEFEKK